MTDTAEGTAREAAIDGLHWMFYALDTDRAGRTPIDANRRWEYLRDQATKIVDNIIQASVEP